MRGIAADYFARQLREIDGNPRSAGHAGLEAREIQQLLHQAPRSLGALAQLLERRVARRRRLRALRELRLQRERRDRRAQLVRCIGEEAPLRIERRGKAREQRIDLLDQRQQLARQAAGRQRVEPRYVAIAHRLRGDLQRREAAAQRPGEERREQRYQQQHRHQHRQRKFPRQHIARRHRLPDLDDAFGRDMRVEPPPAVGGADIRESLAVDERRIVGQRGQQRLEIHASGGVVGAHRERKAGSRDAQPARQRPVFAHVHRERHLAQLLVEHATDLVARQGVGAGEHREAAKRDGADQPQHEIAPNGLQCSWATR